MTVTEILRLHLLTSGANAPGVKWRYMHRGGYSSLDNPGLELYLNEPDILNMLATHNVVKLSIEHKFKLLNCLINQLLTYADVRDMIEEKITNSRQAKFQLKLALIAERKRQNELKEAKKKLQKDNVNKTKLIVDEMEKLNKENEIKLTKHEKEVEKLLKDSTDFQVFLG